MPPAGSLPKSDGRTLRWIGLLQLIKGLLLLAIALGFLSVIHKDLDEIAAVWMSKAGINIENQRVADFLEALDLVTDKQLFQITIAGFCFSGVLIAQGTGLLLRQQWAKYLTLIATTLLIPFEAFELMKGFGYIKLTVLLVNIAIVILMIALLRRSRGQSAAASLPKPGAAAPVFAAERS